MRRTKLVYLAYLVGPQKSRQTIKAKVTQISLTNAGRFIGHVRRHAVPRNAKIVDSNGSCILVVLLGYFRTELPSRQTVL